MKISAEQNNEPKWPGDWFYAYRKAKVDCFYDRLINKRWAFARYENNLVANLHKLHQLLEVPSKKQDGSDTNVGKDDTDAKANSSEDSDDNGVFVHLEKVLQRYVNHRKLVAKTLSTEVRSERVIPQGENNNKQDNNPEKSWAYFSDSDRAFNVLRRSHDLVPEMRLIGDFPVEMHVLSALWINRIGCKFDAQLSDVVYGSRLRRYRSSDQKTEKIGSYHKHALHSFKPYLRQYKAWQDGAFKTIRRELKANNAIIVLSMDISNFYHRIDPSFFGDDKFLDDVGIDLDGWEKQF